MYIVCILIASSQFRVPIFWSSYFFQKKGGDYDGHDNTRFNDFVSTSPGYLKQCHYMTS